MSIGQYGTTGAEPSEDVPLPAAKDQPLQRLALVRRLQGVSRRTVARRLNLEIEQVREQEKESTDVSVSMLYAWHEALDVPVAELLVEAGDALTAPVLERSRLVRLMKTVLAIREHAKQESIRRMAETMAGQLVEIMPELANIGPWKSLGKRRGLNDLGVAADRRLSDELFVDSDDE